MIITETKLTTRSSVTDTFFSDSPLSAARTALKEVLIPLVSNNKFTHASTLSANGLVQTNVTTFDGLDTYSLSESATGIIIDYEYTQWEAANNLNQNFEGLQQYTQSGINQEFTCTTVYSHDANVAVNYPKFEFFVNVIESSDNLESFTNTGSQLIAVHRYLNSDDFNVNHWRDFKFAVPLHTAGITRTITYALV